ncbi:hypothetical protein [Nonomuraea zeae]|uniref:Bacterial Ig domain-containing protein n=1 Tax=Nonomuraea zeae TaxID=1642303 RepID=A0A5S4GV39_9ACTN|nr:hypothetical protein [Nonomuraea zeae]TMR36324.1 hypothetical protein ETD85_11015 [Nonomuraea zeae]
MRFAKPLTVTLASAALVALPFAGSALADGARPQPTATVKAPQPTHSAPAKTQDRPGKDARHQEVSLKVAVNPSRVRAGSSYGVTIVVKGSSTGTATVTSPEGKSYRVSLSGGRATKTLSVPARAKAGSKTVSVKVGNKVATASFTVVAGKDRKHDDRRHVAK